MGNSKALNLKDHKCSAINEIHTRDRYLDDIRMHHLHDFPENFYKVYHNKKPIDRTNLVAIHNSKDNFNIPNASSMTERQNSIRFNDLPIPNTNVIFFSY